MKFSKFRETTPRLARIQDVNLGVVSQNFENFVDKTSKSAQTFRGADRDMHHLLRATFPMGFAQGCVSEQENTPKIPKNTGFCF